MSDKKSLDKTIEEVGLMRAWITITLFIFFMLLAVALPVILVSKIISALL